MRLQNEDRPKTMLPKITNLLNIPSDDSGKELVLQLLTSPAFKLEQIVSNGEPSGNGFWYDQKKAEWVALLRGSATLRFEGEGTIKLTAGDCLVIPARVRHRVDVCSRDALWLALHFEEKNA
jgi:cupin 2 domain-containing protein